MLKRVVGVPPTTAGTRFDNSNIDRYESIHLLDCKNWVIYKNDFENIDTFSDPNAVPAIVPKPYQKYTAIFANKTNTDPIPARIFKNTFMCTAPNGTNSLSNTLTANHIMGQQLDLKIECNEYSDFYYDWYIDNNSALSDQLTSGSKDAANVFTTTYPSGTNNLQGISIYNNGTGQQNFVYYYDGNVGGSRIPDVSGSSVNPQSATTPNECDDIPNCDEDIVGMNDKYMHRMHYEIFSYPVPASSHIVINLNNVLSKDVSSFEVTDLQGKLTVLQPTKVNNEGTWVLNSTALAPGFYILNVSLKNGSIISKKLEITK